MTECYSCGFWDSDREGCACPSMDMWYACPMAHRKERSRRRSEIVPDYLGGWRLSAGEETEVVFVTDTDTDTKPYEEGAEE